MKKKTEELFEEFMSKEASIEKEKRLNKESLQKSLKENIGTVLKDLADPLSPLALYITSVNTYDCIENKVNTAIRKEVIVQTDYWTELKFVFSLFKADSDIRRELEGEEDYLYIIVGKNEKEHFEPLFNASYPWHHPDFLEYATYASKIQKSMKVTLRETKEAPSKPVYSDGSNLNDYPPLRGC